MRRTFLRLFIVAGLCAATAFSVACWLAASRLICPTRRVIQDYHLEILGHASAHGLLIRSFAIADGEWKGTPCLVCEPARAPGLAEKGNKLRTQLAAEGISLKPWGEIIGSLVLLHGHTGRKEDHLPVAERLCAAGFRCVLPDLPGHGDHPVKFAAFGFREASLPAAALSSAATAFQFDPEPAGIFGISQGGAIALQAAAADPRRWIAVAELSSFAALDDVIENQARNYFGPLWRPARQTVSALVKWRAGYDPASIRPRDAAAKLDSMRVLIGHGDQDTFVPPSQAKVLFAAVPAAEKQFLSVAGAGHSTVLITSQPVYATLAKFFTTAALPPAETISLSPAASPSQ